MPPPSERKNHKQPEQYNLAGELAKYYLAKTTYADTARRIDEKTVEVAFTIQDYHCDPNQQPSVRGDFIVTGADTTNTLIIDGQEPRHTDGHFREETGTSLFQAHLADGMLIEAGRHNQPALWLVSLRSIAHADPGFPGEIAAATFTTAKEDETGKIGKGTVRCG